MQSFVRPALAALAALVTSLLACNWAHAASTSAAISNVRLQLVDLDLSDGIAPAIQFSNYSTYVSVAQYPSHAGETVTLPTLDVAVGPLSLINPDATAIAASLGGGLLSDSGWSATAAASTLPGMSYSNAAVVLSTQFTLTPNTLLLMSADVTTFEGHAHLGQRSIPQAEFELDDSQGAVLANPRAYANLVDGASINAPRQLQASFANLADTAMEGKFSAGLLVRSINYDADASPIPEPRNSALLFAGLLAIGALVRQRTSR